MSKRVEWVDIAKYICIICVMASHLESMKEEFWQFFGPFFLTLFFFCSGYVYKHRKGFREHLVKKFRQLFIPWLVFSVFNILLSQIFSFNEHTALTTELMWNFLQIRGMGDGIWFVAALFVSYIPFYFYIEWYEKKATTSQRQLLFLLPAFLLSFASLLYEKLMNSSLLPWNSVKLPWHAEYVFQAMLYMVLGYVFRTLYESYFDRHNKRIARVVLLLLYLAFVYLLPKAGLITRDGFFYTYVSQLLGISLIISLCKVVKTNAYIAYIGANTLICFGLHGKVLSVLQVLLWKLCGGVYSKILSNTVTSSVFSIVLSIVISFVLIIPIWLINRYVPFVVGRTRKTGCCK